MPRTIIILLGCPGAGKGTQARIIKRSLPIPHISTGAILRDEIAAQTELGRGVLAQIRSGQLVSDAIVDRLIAQRIRKSDCAHGFILDGYPRTVSQAKSLQKMLRSSDRVVTIGIEISIDELVSRLKRRLLCTRCNAVYNTESAPPTLHGLCDHCGTELIQREDDREETTRERFRIYQDVTQPLIDHFRRSGSYRAVNGMRSTKSRRQ
jgi:adenylate kinase